MIDTLTYAKKLEEQGFTKNEAEALIMLASELSFHHLATKQDFVNQTHAFDIKLTQIEHKFGQQEDKFDIKLKDMEQRLTLRLGIMMASMFTVFFAALTFVIQK